MQSYTSQTITSIKALARDCAKSKAQGYVIDDEEYVQGVRCLAAPVRDKDGAIIASIGISAPIARFSPERDASVAQQVREVAMDLSIVFSAEPPE